MPNVIDNGDGSVTVQTEDGRSVRTTKVAAQSLGLSVPDMGALKGDGTPDVVAPAAPTFDPVANALDDLNAKKHYAAGLAPGSWQANQYATEIGKAHSNYMSLLGQREARDGYAASNYGDGPPATSAPAAVEQAAPPPQQTAAATAAQGSGRVSYSGPLHMGTGVGTDYGLTKANAEFYKAKEQEANAARAASNAASEANKAEIVGRQEASDLMQQQAVENQNREQSRHEYVKGFADKFQQAADELSKPLPKVDPNRFWADKGTGSRVLGALAMAAGAFGSSITHTPNYAMELINKAVNDDIDAQKANIANEVEGRRSKLQASQSLYGMAMQMTGDERQADVTARALALNAVEARTQALIAQAKDPAIKANLDQTLAAVQASKAGYMQQASQIAYGRAVENEKLGLERQKIAVEYGAKVAKGANAQKIPASEAALIGDFEAALATLRKRREDFKKLGAGAGLTQYFPGSDAKKYENNRKPTAQVVGNPSEGGKLTDPDFERYFDMIPTPGTTEGTGLAKFDAVEELLKAKRRGKIEGLRKAGFDTSGFETPADSYNEKGRRF